ncbi:hypothetical protein [Candidatus Poriferisocius sp.]|uniref:hypothetical protein n=1 Tax=Candidatus Poriferisocius sp. TaxID=3101276 RepID=UPI003B5CF35D
MSSAGDPAIDREGLEKLLDAVVYAPLGLLLSTHAPPAELAAHGRRQLEAARLLGRMALGQASAPPAPAGGGPTASPADQG